MADIRFGVKLERSYILLFLLRHADDDDDDDDDNLRPP